jgi:hypothetical protein
MPKEPREIYDPSWRCPNTDCRAIHSKVHWPDHHQKEPGWKDNLGSHNCDKASNPDFKTVCEICGTPLVVKPHKRPMISPKKTWCPKCEAIRKGIPAPLFCPHCGYTEERLIIVRV